MKLQDFINKYNGKFINFDHAFGPQCMDNYRQYTKEVWQLPQTPGVTGAYQVFNTLPKNYQKFINGIPQAGDVITWNENYVKNGHIAVVVSASGLKFKSFDQNNPEHSPCRITDHTYKNVIGWFRPIKSLNNGDMFRTYKGTIYALLSGYWVAVATTYPEFQSDFGNITAPDMTDEQFKAFPVTRPVIK